MFSSDLICRVNICSQVRGNLLRLRYTKLYFTPHLGEKTPTNQQLKQFLRLNHTHGKCKLCSQPSPQLTTSTTQQLDKHTACPHNHKRAKLSDISRHFITSNKSLKAPLLRTLPILKVRHVWRQRSTSLCKLYMKSKHFREAGLGGHRSKTWTGRDANTYASLMATWGREKQETIVSIATGNFHQCMCQSPLLLLSLCSNA